MQNHLDIDTIQIIKREIIKHSLPAHFFSSLNKWLLPLAVSIHAQYTLASSPIIISFNGAQGSGKSTITHFIALLLQHHFKANSINLSLDDFYLSQSQRIQLAHDIHPLLKTRGVPGTHDVGLAIKTLNALKTCSSANPCFIPQFDKALDDRKPHAKWNKVSRPIDIILFEGWCNHAPFQNEMDLLAPMNALEREEDPEGIWRVYVNQQLKKYHKELFSLCDYLFFMKIPSFRKVFEWRSLQEQKLAQTNDQKNILSKKGLFRFIQHYERITRQCLLELPTSADTVIELNNDHQIQSIINNSQTITKS